MNKILIFSWRRRWRLDSDEAAVREELYEVLAPAKQEILGFYLILPAQSLVTRTNKAQEGSTVTF